MKLFVWDFHGVLEKGNDDIVFEITNNVLEKHGHSRRMSKEECELLSGRLWRNYFLYLIPELNENEASMLHSACIEMEQNSPELFDKHIKLNDHVEYVLEAIQKSNHSQILISNTQPKILDFYVKLIGIKDYFPSTHRFGVDSSTCNRKTKKDHLHEFLDDNKNFKEIISIGDSPSDMDLINVPSMKGTSYLYSYPTRAHRIAECHYKIDDLRRVLQEIKAPVRENRVSIFN